MDKKETTYKEAGRVSEKTLARLRQRFGNKKIRINIPRLEKERKDERTTAPDNDATN